MCKGLMGVYVTSQRQNWKKKRERQKIRLAEVFFSVFILDSKMKIQPCVQ